MLSVLQGKQLFAGMAYALKSWCEDLNNLLVVKRKETALVPELEVIQLFL